MNLTVVLVIFTGLRDWLPKVSTNLQVPDNDSLASVRGTRDYDSRRL